MVRGFFSAAALPPLRATPSRIPKCGACGLLHVCASPKIPVAGHGRKGIMIINDFPDEADDVRGRGYTGPAAAHLDSLLSHNDVDMLRDCWLTSALICRPPRGRLPEKKNVIDFCRPNVLKAISEHKPRTIILLGYYAVKSVIGHIWKSNVGNSIDQWAGWQIPSQTLNAWVAPIWEPSQFIGEDTKWRKERAAMAVLFRRYLKRALSHTSRPWPKNSQPDYPSQVERIYDPAKAAKIIRRMVRAGGIAAWDYETNALKPEYPGAEIVTCSICHEGERTIAYPWRGEAVDATIEFLRSPRVWKIASNMKFEDRWSRHKLGVRIRNWLWDTMQGAHVADCRSGITSIKFLQFVHLGAPSYNDTIEPFLESTEKSKLNRIHQAPMDDLLLYNGLDSLYEYLVAMIQMKQLNYPFRERIRNANS